MSENYDLKQKVSKGSPLLSGIFAIAILLFTLNGWGQQVTVTYTTPGSYSFTVPQGATAVIGKAAGGGSSAEAQASYAAGNLLTLTVGAGSADGSAGENSSITYNGATTTASGGNETGDNGKVVISFSLTKPEFSVTSPACSGREITFTVTNVAAGVTCRLFRERSFVADFSEGSCTVAAAEGDYFVRALYSIDHTGGALSLSGGAAIYREDIIVDSDPTAPLTVNPTPFIPSQRFSVCSGEAFSFGTGDFGGNYDIPAGTTFAWSEAVLATGISGTPTTDAAGTIAGTLANSTANDIPAALTATVTPTASGCVGNPFSVAINVQAAPDIMSNISLAPMCSGSLNFVPQNGTHGTVPSSTQYKWTASHTANMEPIAAQPDYQNDIQANMVNRGTDVETVTFTVTCRRPACPATAKTFTLTLTVNPTPAFTFTNPEPACYPNTIDLSATITNLAPAGCTIRYYDDYYEESGLLIGELQGTDITQQGNDLNSNTYSYRTAYIQVTSADGCKSAVYNVTMNFNASPIINSFSNGSTVLCVGDVNFTIYNLTWSVAEGSEGLVSVQGGDITGLAAGTATVIATWNGCPATYTFAVREKPVIETPATTLFCPGDTYTFSLTQATNHLAGGKWRSYNSNNPESYFASIDSLSGLFTAKHYNPYSFSHYYYYNISYEKDGCASYSQSVSVYNRPSPPITSNVSRCVTSESGVISWASLVKGNHTFQWYSEYPNAPLSAYTSPADVPVNAASAKQTFYVTQKSYNGCESDTASVSIEILDAGSTPHIDDIVIYNECATATETEIDILDYSLLTPPTGTDLQFKDIEGEGYYANTAALPEGFTTFKTNEAGTYTWTARQKTGECYSNDYTITAIVKALPSAHIGFKAKEYEPGMASEQARTVCPGEDFELQIDFSQEGDYIYNINYTSYNSMTENPSFAQLSSSYSTTYYLIWLYDKTTGCSVSGDYSNPVGSGAPALTVRSYSSSSTVYGGCDFSLSLNIDPPLTLNYTIDGEPKEFTSWEVNEYGRASVNFQFDSEGTYVITSVTDSYGCVYVNSSLPYTQIAYPPINNTMADYMKSLCEGVPFIKEVEEHVAEDNGGGELSFGWIIIHNIKELEIETFEDLMNAMGSGDIVEEDIEYLSSDYIPAYKDHGDLIIMMAMSGGCIIGGEEQAIAITRLNIIPTLAGQAFNTTVCSGVPLTFTPAGMPEGATYAWSVEGIPAAIGGISSTLIGAETTWEPAFAQTLTNSADQPVDVHYTLYVNSECPSTATCTVTVNPALAIADKNYAVCSGNAFTLAPAMGDIAPAGATFTWTVAPNEKVSGQSAGSGSMSEMSQTLTNNDAAAQTVVYTVTPAVGDCEGTPFTVTVRVYPPINMELVSDDISAIIDGSLQTCTDEKCDLVLTGVPPFDITYTVNGNPPSSLGLPSIFDEVGNDGKFILEHVSGTTYSVELPPFAPGTYTFQFTKIETGNDCKVERE